MSHSSDHAWEWNYFFLSLSRSNGVQTATKCQGSAVTKGTETGAVISPLSASLSSGGCILQGLVCPALPGQTAGLWQRALQRAFPFHSSQGMVGLSPQECANFLVPAVVGSAHSFSPGSGFSAKLSVPVEQGGCWKSNVLLSPIAGRHRWLGSPAEHGSITALSFPCGRFRSLCFPRQQ